MISGHFNKTKYRLINVASLVSASLKLRSKVYYEWQQGIVKELLDSVKHKHVQKLKLGARFVKVCHSFPFFVFAFHSQPLDNVTDCYWGICFIRFGYFNLPLMFTQWHSMYLSHGFLFFRLQVYSQIGIIREYAVYSRRAY